MIENASRSSHLYMYFGLMIVEGVTLYYAVSEGLPPR